MKELETAAPDDRLTGKTHEELTLILVEMVRTIMFMCRRHKVTLHRKQLTYRFHW